MTHVLVPKHTTGWKVPSMTIKSTSRLIRTESTKMEVLNERNKELSSINPFFLVTCDIFLKLCIVRGY